MNRMIKLTSLLLLVVLCVGVLASCGISSYEKRLEKAGYTVIAAEKDELKEYDEADTDYGYKKMSAATKGADYVYVVKLQNKKQAKLYAEECATVEKWTTETKGSVVVFGSEAAVKAAFGE